VANIVPKDTAAVIEAWEKGQTERAKQLYYKLLPLCQAMFYETNPIPVKTSLALMGKMDVEMRLPLCPLASANLDRLKKALKDYGLIN
jgi:4-hydroxy-tetrahydrodipicolinate synthase